MRKHIGLALAAFDLVAQAQTRVAVSPARDAGQLVQAVAVFLGIGLCKGGGCQHHRAGPIGDLAAVLAARAGLNHRVGFVVVGEAQGIELPLAGLRQRVAFGVAVIELGNAVQVPAVQAIAALVFLRQQTKGGWPHEGAVHVFMALPRGRVLVDRGFVARGVFELFHTHDQHAVVAPGFNFGHGRQHPQRRRGAGPFVAHGGHAPELGRHLRHHGA